MKIMQVDVPREKRVGVADICRQFFSELDAVRVVFAKNKYYVYRMGSNAKYAVIDPAASNIEWYFRNKRTTFIHMDVIRKVLYDE